MYLVSFARATRVEIDELYPDLPDFEVPFTWAPGIEIAYCRLPPVFQLVPITWTS